MTELTEAGITSQYIGKPVSQEHLAKCACKNNAYKNGQGYIIYSCGFLYDQELRQLFGITDRLKDLWERRGTDFNVCVVVEDQKILSCAIDKHHETEGARPSVYDLKCTQQDLRVARRILDYITCE